jgi:DNA invertase Pin-like site-specific DNA recombinase
MATMDARQIIKKINGLLSQLEKKMESQDTGRGVYPSKPAGMAKKGPAGLISTLLDDGFFEEPRELQAVLNKMREMGHSYSRQSIAMNLLNMTKGRILSRTKSKSTGTWQYIINK